MCLFSWRPRDVTDSEDDDDYTMQPHTCIGVDSQGMSSHMGEGAAATQILIFCRVVHFQWTI